MSRTSTPAASSIDCTNGGLFARLLCCWRLKLGLAIALTLMFCGPYCLLTHHAYFPARKLPLSLLDRSAGFNTRWVWPYQSIYLLTGTLPWLAVSREQLRRYVHGFALLSGVCFLIFLLLPVQCPRPQLADPMGMYGALLWYDGPYNSFPSLHAGLLYYTLAFARRVYGRVRWQVQIVLTIWSAMILWATLATKEHYAVDLVAGIALAALADAAAWSRIFRSSGAKSHGGSR